MKNLYVIILTLIIGMTLQISSAISQSFIQDFVNHYFDKRDQFESLTAEVHFAQKKFAMDDTMLTKAVIEMVSVPDDTIFGGHVFIETEGKTYAYDGVTSYFGDRSTSTITINEIANNPSGSILHDWASFLIENSFLIKNQSGRTATTNPDFKPMVTDTVLAGWPCKGIQLTFPDRDGYTDIIFFTAFDTIEYMLRHRSISMYYQENEQYQAWTYFNPVYGHQMELTKLNDKFLSSFKHQKMQDDIVYEIPKVDQVEIDYSTLKGRIMLSGEAFDIKEIDADIIVLDFWYSGCYPCIQSIPEVNRVYDRFRDQRVAVYGVNIIDDELKNKTRIEKYVRNNPMSYQTIMADHTIYDPWVPYGYPMLLILNKELELIEMHDGYTEGMADEIAEVIEAHLKD